MSAIGVCALCAAALLLVYLLLIAPCKKVPDTSKLMGYLYAHRGLHDHNKAVAENSLNAFRLAVENGYGMELDVQRTKDGQMVVFHDGDLRRLCGRDQKLLDMTYEELKAIALPDGSYIPLFTEVLQLVKGRAPMIVEVKHYGGAAQNAQMAWEILQGYEGPFCVESFHPLAMRYFKKHVPQVVRGQLANGAKWNSKEISALAHFAMKHLLVNAISRPHFVAYSCPQDHTLGQWLMKRAFKPYLACWTVRQPEVLEKARTVYDWPIFEGFRPEP